MGDAKLMREVNDRIHAVLADTKVEDGDFVCECDDAACLETVTITLREYAARHESGLELIAAKHYGPEARKLFALSN